MHDTLSSLPSGIAQMALPYNWRDVGCRGVLKHPETMAALVEVLFANECVDLDLGALRAEPTRQSGPGLRQAENDVIWGAPRGPDGECAYFLVEVQSTAEPDMALRMMDYVALYAQDLRSAKHLKRPAIAPVVLYTGERRWHGSLDAGELFTDVVPGRQGRLLHYLVDLSRLELPEGSENLVLLLAAVVRGESEKELVGAARALYERLVALGGRGLEQSYFELVRGLAVDKWPDGNWENCKNMAELVNALEDHVQTWPEKWKANAKAEGRAETSLEVLASLAKVVRARFGDSVAEAFGQHVNVARRADGTRDRELLDAACRYVALSANAEELLAGIRSHHSEGA